MREVITLVKGQIASTGKTVKAVLMVGGFGQNAYLRESIRAAIDPGIEVMQPPNGWTAVVRGALMKGLSQVEPTTARVKVASRTARKHYGTEIMSRFDPAKHLRSGSFWDDFDGELKVYDMSWFITKGSPVTEDRSFTKHYHKVWRVSEGPRQCVQQDIFMFADPLDTGAPIYKDVTDVRHLTRLTANLMCIPTEELGRKMGKDGHEYYVVYYDIEMTYFSAHTKYTLVYKQVKYDSVTAEYV